MIREGVVVLKIAVKRMVVAVVRVRVLAVTSKGYVRQFAGPITSSFVSASSAHPDPPASSPALTAPTRNGTPYPPIPRPTLLSRPGAHLNFRWLSTGDKQRR